MRSRSRWLLLLAGAALAVVLFLVFRDNGGETTPGPRTIEITLEDGKPVGGITEATVKEGARVTLVVRSDVADEIHLHGYDLHRELDAGGTVRLAFIADITGRFEGELEDNAVQILDLKVEP